LFEIGLEAQLVWLVQEDVLQNSCKLL